MKRLEELRRWPTDVAPPFLPLLLLFLAVVLVPFCGGAAAAAANGGTSPSEPYLERKLNSLLKSHDIKDADVSLRVVSAENGEVLFSYHANRPLKVASNMKLLTTAAALTTLGRDFTYTTCVRMTGVLSNGVLSGDVILTGSGDPNISGRFYGGNVTAVPEMWVDAVEGMGVEVVEGDIVVDDTVFDREYVNPTWPRNQLSRWYCAQISGLSMNDNCIDITILPASEPGGGVKTIIEPETDYVNIINTCKTTAKKSDHLYALFRKDGTNDIYLRGSFWNGVERQKEWVTIDRPPLFTAAVFKGILSDRGIAVRGDCRFVRGTDREGIRKAETLVCTASTLEQAIKVTNTSSQNFYAEQLLKTVGAAVYDEGTFSAGLEVIREMISGLGHDRSEYEVADGSGLSHGNRLTTSIITDLLCFMYKHKHGDVFIGSLPVAGVSGTLKKRMVDPPYKGRTRAKTGYILSASALSGYTETLDGDMLVFSLLINDFDVSNRLVKRVQDSICRALVDSRR